MSTFTCRWFFQLMLLASITLCVVSARARAHQPNNAFRDKQGNFQIIFPGEVKQQVNDAGVRTFTCTMGTGSVEKFYLVGSFPVEANVTPLDYFFGQANALHQRHGDVRLLHITPISCSGHYGYYGSFLYNQVKRGGIEYPSGVDMIVIRTGDRMFHLEANQFFYESAAKASHFTFGDLPNSSKRFFESFRILDPKQIKGKVQTCPETLMGTWVLASEDGTKQEGLFADDEYFHVTADIIRQFGVLKNEYLLRANVKPKQIAIAPGTESEILGIFQLEGDRLQYASTSRTIKNRPESFEGESAVTLSRPKMRIITEVTPQGKK